MDIKQTYSTDLDLEVNGVWVTTGDAKFLIARMHNPDYNERLLAAMKPYKRQQLSKDESLKLMVAIEAETILLDWDGVTENGQPVPYSKEKAREYLMIKDFRAQVMEAATSMHTFKAEEVEEGEKNSQTP